MQSYDGDKLINTESGTPEELAQRVKQMPKATHHVIGKMPNKGATITLNGLNYEITYVDKVMGKFHAKILNP